MRGSSTNGHCRHFFQTACSRSLNLPCFINVRLCSVRSTARFDGTASNLRRITCWKRALQFLVQLKVEFSLSRCARLSFTSIRSVLFRPVVTHDCRLI